MKKIYIGEYNANMGILIDLEKPDIFQQKHVDGAINIPYETLLYNKDKLLDKNKTYYLYCKGGYKSRNATNLLNAYGYNVIQVLLK